MNEADKLGAHLTNKDVKFHDNAGKTFDIDIKMNKEDLDSEIGDEAKTLAIETTVRNSHEKK